MPQTTEGLPVAFAVALGIGVVLGIEAVGGTPVFELDDPDDPELADPEPDEQAIGWFEPAGCSVPTRTSSWLTGS